MLDEAALSHAPQQHTLCCQCLRDTDTQHAQKSTSKDMSKHEFNMLLER